MALSLLFSTEGACAALERALALARSGGFILTFVDLPPLAKLLHELRKRRKVHQVADQKWDTYCQRILAAMTTLPSQAVSKEELLRQEGLEPLTDRELHILRLLDGDLSNKEIEAWACEEPDTLRVERAK